MIIASFSKASDGIVREASLFHAAQPEMLIWQSEENALVVPSALARRDDMKGPMADAASKGWPVTTRGSGGGFVPQGPSTLNLAMVVAMSDAFTLDEGYRLICDIIAEALKQFDVTSTTGPRENAFCDGQWNVLVDGRKLAGTAQRWRATSTGRVSLIHAAILIRTPDTGLWPALRRLHKIALPTAAQPRAGAHVAMEEIIHGNIKFNSFPSALFRAAVNGLSNHLSQDYKAA